MKRLLSLGVAMMLILCSCTFSGNVETSPTISDKDKDIVGKWIDVKTEKIHEYTADGYYYEYINESFTTDKTRYVTDGGKIFYYLDGEEPDMEYGIEYEIKNGRLIIAGELEYKPMDIKTSLEEME